jgi:glycosyltransferase involved in cell wall biosynthesis
MRIIWLCPYPLSEISHLLISKENLGHFKGTWISNLAAELSQNPSLELHVITHHSKIVKEQSVKNNNITFHVIKYAYPYTSRGFNKLFRWDILTLYTGFISRAVKLINDIKPDIIHAWGTEGAYALTACKTRYPSMVSMQGVISAIYKESFSLPYLMQKWLEQKAIKEHRYFDCRTDFDKKFVLSVNPDARIFFIPRAINRSFFLKQWSPVIAPSLLFIGSVTKIKGIETLICALPKVIEKFPSLKLRIIGGSKTRYNDHLKIIINKLNLNEHIIWLGFQVSKFIANELMQTTIYVLPSFIENSPNSLAEAMAIGTPCVASNAGGIPSMIKNNEDGIIFEKGDPEDLAKKILIVLDNNTLQQKLSKNAREAARERNFPTSIAVKAVHAYESIIQECKK